MMSLGLKELTINFFSPCKKITSYFFKFFYGFLTIWRTEKKSRKFLYKMILNWSLVDRRSNLYKRLYRRESLHKGRRGQTKYAVFR